MQQLTLNQWNKELSNEQKIEILLRLKRKSFLPLINIVDMQKVLYTDKANFNELFEELKKIKPIILNKQKKKYLETQLEFGNLDDKSKKVFEKELDKLNANKENE